MPDVLTKPYPIGPRIKALRKQQGILLKDVAARVGVTIQMVSLYESGDCNIPSSRIPAIARALNVTPGDLVPALPEEEPARVN